MVGVVNKLIDYDQKCKKSAGENGRNGSHAAPMYEGAPVIVRNEIGPKPLRMINQAGAARGLTAQTGFCEALDAIPSVGPWWFR